MSAYVFEEMDGTLSSSPRILNPFRASYNKPSSMHSIFNLFVQLSNQQSEHSPQDYRAKRKCLSDQIEKTEPCIVALNSAQKTPQYILALYNSQEDGTNLVMQMASVGFEPTPNHRNHTYEVYEEDVNLGGVIDFAIRKSLTPKSKFSVSELNDIARRSMIDRYIVGKANSPEEADRQAKQQVKMRLERIAQGINMPMVEKIIPVYFE